MRSSWFWSSGLRHLTPDEIERLAGGTWPLADGPLGDIADEAVAHLDACGDCREDVEAVRALSRCLADLPDVEPRRSLADAVLADVDLPAPWLDEALSSLPELAPSTAFQNAVLERVDLPAPWLAAALERMPQTMPDPGFASRVMERVRLPIPWHRRVGRFVEQRRVALAGAATATVAMSAAGAGWLFGIQGVTPMQFVLFVLGGVRQLAVRGLLAVGEIGYQLGLVDAGSAITDISPAAALGSLALAGAVGLASLLVMARLMRGGPAMLVERAGAARG